jgi:undecaprenyl-diphosphatase
LALIGLGVWGFVELADQILGGNTHAFDRAVLIALRNPADLNDPLGPLWMEEMVRDFSAMGGMGLISFFSLAWIGFLALQRKFRAALFLAATVFGGIGLSLILKAGFDRPRPEFVSHGTEVFTSAFPSGHSMLAAIVYLSLGAVLARFFSGRRLKAYVFLVAVVLTVLVGFSRVYLGVHWPTDVVGGWLAGSFWALLLWFVARALQRRRTIEDDAPEPE